MNEHYDVLKEVDENVAAARFPTFPFVSIVSGLYKWRKTIRVPDIP